MSEEFNPMPETLEGKKSNKNVIIIVVAVLLLCCCCVAVGVGGYYAWMNY
jgi:flagellar basal body-associated protein FliL